MAQKDINPVNEFKVQKLARDVMELMETLGFTCGEAELLPDVLRSFLDRNKKRLAEGKPFCLANSD